MATYNNKHWLLSHIRNSFISTDDTGMCEAVMSDDLPSKLSNNSELRRSQNFKTGTPLNSKNARPPDDFICYPGVADHDDDDDALLQSYDIHMDTDIGRHRSNTAQKLERMDAARRKASKIKNIKCDDSQALLNSFSDNRNLFVKKKIGFTVVPDIKPSASDVTAAGLAPVIIDQPHRVNSLLSDQLLKCPKQPQNKFLEYARFDGTSQTGIPTRTIKIFLTMLPEKVRNYPMQICVTAAAKIVEFIGLICYKCSIEYPNVQLISVKSYGLFITEEDGEVDMDFPALDLREPCSKFCFSHLALVERKSNDQLCHQSTYSSNYDHRTLSMTSESELNRIAADLKAKTEQQDEDLARMMGHTTMMEAHDYKSYRLNIVSKGVFKTEIQLGISGEKIEIDPVQQKNNRFWHKQKAVSYPMDTIAWCDLVEAKTTRAVFRIVYSLTYSTGAQQQQYETAITTITSTVATSSATANLNQLPLQTSASFKHYEFETDPKTAHEIVEKINNILEVRSSTSRREYLSSKYKKKLLSSKKIQTLSSSK